MGRKNRNRDAGIKAEVKPVVLTVPVEPLPPLSKGPLAFAIFFATVCVGAVFYLASRYTFLHWDSYLYLNGARYINGWEGTWLHAYGHPFVSFFYSRLLLITQRYKDFELEIRAACLLNATIAAVGLTIGAYWLRKVLANSAWIWAAAVALLFGNILVIEFGPVPLSDYIGLTLGATALLISFRAIETNNRRLHILAAAIFGITVPLKYHLWLASPTAILCDLIVGPKRPFKDRLRYLAFYPILGALFAAAGQLYMWYFHPPQSPNTISAIFADFFKMYRGATVETPNPMIDYYRLVANMFGGPAGFALLGWGLYHSYKSTNFYVRLNAVWFTTFAIGLNIYQYMDRYVIHFLPAVIGVMGVGLATLPGFKSVRAEVVRGAAALYVIGSMLITSTVAFHRFNSYTFTDPMWIKMGDWIRPELPAERRPFLSQGSETWATFINQRIPIDFSSARGGMKGVLGIPAQVLPYLNDGDVFFGPPRAFDFEFTAAKIKVVDYPRISKSSTGSVFSDGRGGTVAVQAGQPFPKEFDPLKESWMVALSDKRFMVARPRSTKLVLDQNTAPLVEGLRRITIAKEKYFSVQSPR